MRLRLSAGFLTLFLMVIGGGGCGTFNTGGGSSTWQPWKNLPELGAGPVTLEVSPLDASAYNDIMPLGRLASDQHPIPTDHIYFCLTDSGFSAEVLAPADGIITMVQHTQTDWPAGSGYSGTADEYQLYISLSNTFMIAFGHLSGLAPSIEAQAGSLPIGYSDLNIPVQQGEVIAKTAKSVLLSACLDMWAFDKDIELDFIHPDKYGELMPHTVCPLDYFKQDIKDTLYQSVRRTAPPRGGKIDFDQAGKLVGNWFLEGHGVEDQSWAYQMSFVYDVYDPSLLEIGLGGTLSIPAINYTVEANAPDPAAVDVSSGEVVYRLRGTSEFGQQATTATILVQMINDEKIKVEGFDDWPSNPAFTSQAKYYTR